MKVIVHLLGFTFTVMNSSFILYTRETVNAFKKYLDSFELRYLSIISVIAGVDLYNLIMSTIRDKGKRYVSVRRI